MYKINNRYVHSVVEIDLSRLRKNALTLRNLYPGVKQLAVVKADAYGHGAKRVSLALHDIVEWFGVATVDEALELRYEGVTKPILVLNPPMKELAKWYKEYDLTALVSHSGHFDRLESGTSYHIKFDTGMGRLGFLPHELDEVHKAIALHKDKHFTGLMTHFASSDQPQNAKVTEQLERFIAIRASFPSDIVVHVSNSGGSLFYPDARFDMVRTGLALFGYSPDFTPRSDLQPVMQWKSTIVQTKAIPKGHAVSYGASWIAPEAGWLHVVPVGYADGMPRKLGNHQQVKVGTTYFTISGRVTMDYAMFFSPNPIAEGTEVTLMGDDAHTNVLSWAKHAEVLPYEIFCTISYDRVGRRYINP